MDAASVAAMDLAELTTLRLGGPARAVIDATSEQQLLDAVRIATRPATRSCLSPAAATSWSPTRASRHRHPRADPGIAVDSDACSGAMVTVAAGEPWDGIVARAVDEGWVGIEALSGIPGSAGATPIQNVGAYGQEVAQTIATVRAYDRFERKVRTIHAVDCGFGYRTSRFKAEPQRWLVLSVAYQFRLGELSAPDAYAELARTLGVEIGQRAPVSRRPRCRARRCAAARAWCSIPTTTTRGARARSSPTRC